jgi:hypothetical protein
MNKKFVYQVGNNKKVILWCTANQISKLKQPNIKTKTMFNGIVTNTGIIIRATNVVTVVSVSLSAHPSFPSLTIRIKQKTS